MWRKKVTGQTKRMCATGKLLVALTLAFVLTPSYASSDDALPKALSYIASAQQEDGSWPRVKGEAPIETEATTWAVKVLAMNGIEKEKVDKGVAFILKEQRPDGSWGNNTAHTAFALMALNQVKQGPAACIKAVEYLRRVQDADGGFKRIGTDGQPVTIYTSVVLCALRELGYAKDDDMVKRALAWLTSCQNPDGGYGMPKGSPSFPPATGLAVRALLAYDVDPTSAPVKKAVEWVLTAQKPSGGFAVAPPAPEDPETTAYVMMGLGRLKDQKRPVSRAADYLAKVQSSDGAYISDVPQQDNRPAIAKKNMQATCFVAWALSETK